MATLAILGFRCSSALVGEHMKSLLVLRRKATEKNNIRCNFVLSSYVFTLLLPMQ